MRLHVRGCVLGALLLIAGTHASIESRQAGGGEQVADPDFTPRIETPAYSRANVRPLVVLDEAHNNFHTASGRYKPFADLLTADGYRIAAGTQPFSAATLRDAAVLVISNALANGITQANINDPPPAFTDAECDVVRDWVGGGGSLLLIADHAPFGATASALASRFGVEMGKGYAWDVMPGNPEPTTMLVYSRDNGLLGTHAITQDVTRVVTFTGQSLSVPSGAAVLLKFSDSARESAGATTAADFAAHREGRPTSARSIAGRAQGIAFDHGKGRVVMMGEAAMFSAQVARFTDPSGRRNEIRMGMNAGGNDNQQFLLNVMHWLSRLDP